MDNSCDSGIDDVSTEPDLVSNEVSIDCDITTLSAENVNTTFELVDVEVMEFNESNDSKRSISSKRVVDEDKLKDRADSKLLNAKFDEWKRNPIIDSDDHSQSIYTIAEKPDEKGVLHKFKKIPGGKLMPFGYGVKERPFVCNGTEKNTRIGLKCLLCFKTKAHLKRPCIRFHAPPDPITCAECGVQLVYFENWVEHLRLKHPQSHAYHKNRDD